MILLTADTNASTLTPVSDERLHARERLDAAILRALGERRSMREVRNLTHVDSPWDGLDRHVSRAATLLWEMSTLPFTVCDDLLGYCAFLAREIELTEALHLSTAEEWSRLAYIAPRAIAALDAIDGELHDATLGWTAIRRALACVFEDIRVELSKASCQLAMAA